MNDVPDEDPAMRKASQHTDLASHLYMRAGARYIHAGGTSLGFLPAFRDKETHETHLSVDADGNVSAVHLLDGIPEYWVTERDTHGRIIALKEGIAAGYLRSGLFYTRSELAAMPFDG